MSKSLGNVISPQDIIKDYGADILRLWVASSDYNEDIRISKEILTRLSEAYRKIRNTARFILSNLYDFNPDSDKTDETKLRKIDLWILRKTYNDLCQGVQVAYDSFLFHQAYKTIYNFCNETLSMNYLDMIKGRLYTYAQNSVERRAAQTTIYEILNVLVRLMAPILVFTAEEIWHNIPKDKDNESIQSVHLLTFPEAKPYRNEGLDSVISILPQVASILEEMRSKGEIGSSFDAKIKLLTKSQERYTFLESLKDDLAEIFKVSQVEIKKEGDSDIKIEVLKAEGTKCVRCWNYSLSVGRDKTHPLICQRCLEAIGKEK